MNADDFQKVFVDLIEIEKKRGSHKIA